MTDRARHHEQVSAALTRLDGTTESAVALLTGATPAELADLGGVTEPATRRPDDDHEAWLDQLQANLDRLGLDAQIAGSLTHRIAEVAVTPTDGRNPMRVLLDRSPLGGGDARAMAAGTPDEVARRIVARFEEIRDAIHAATPCEHWHCPTSGDVECGTHGGFDTCCARPDLHQPTTSRCG